MNNSVTYYGVGVFDFVPFPLTDQNENDRTVAIKKAFFNRAHDSYDLVEVVERRIEIRGEDVKILIPLYKRKTR